ncbi:hypothetical protein CANCADRAFT_58223 [Tortispora caseinolytica NRRL Y-17796]|uniref:TATA box binding protein associated factor (TAF) histone-like fold domain-containing protein n=1 Tax=Tortispora caseinolytica NRRL Y-17796 TaxID=767744 RepID=A0A1E4TBW2_9ASCO|nr:hypothetical protein CANCADRAFT_58223 [Tortispora caseinolytica NRRL Y-17796]
MSDEAAGALAMDIEYRVHEILEEAMKFMRHSKRSTLSTTDINYALKVLNVEPVFGYESSRPIKFRPVVGQPLYFIEDEEVDLEKVINGPLPKVPKQVAFTAHWLAIEGVQPAIPENPTPDEIQSLPATIKGLDVSRAAATASNVQVKPLVKHILSKELQLYFERIAEALTGDNADLKSAAIGSLRNDPGLHQLVPYLIQIISEQVTHNLANLALMNTMLDTVDALINNKTIFIEPYIHAIMPPVLTLLLAKQVGGDNKDHYKLRDYAGSIAIYLCNKYAQTYHTLKPRVTRTLLRAFMDPSKSPGTHYGALIALKGLGPEVVRLVVLENVKVWSTTLSELPEEDKKVLVAAAKDTLSVLKENEDISEPSEQDKEKVREIVGEVLADEILADDALVRGILAAPSL